MKILSIVLVVLTICSIIAYQVMNYLLMSDSLYLQLVGLLIMISICFVAIATKAWAMQSALS